MRTTRVACDGCGVVQRVQILSDSNVPIEPHTNDECAVCGASLSLPADEGGILG